MTGKCWQRILWLLWLVLPVATAIVPPATFAYDAQWQPIIAYDNPGVASSVGCDAACVPTKLEGQIGTTGAWGLFANFTKFLAAKGTIATRKGLIEISQHLSSLDGGIDPANIAMYERLTRAYEAGEPLLGIDANFYTHELTESGLMNSGMGYNEAHAATLEMQGLKLNAATPAQLYQPSIILKYSESFNPASHP